MSPNTHGSEPVSSWVKKWSHLLPPQCSVLDIACGQGRHMKWFAGLGHQVTGIDRSVESIDAVKSMGEAYCADIENETWPLLENGQIRQFDAVVVTNYLWRALFPVIAKSLRPAGVLIYETFAAGNETVGRPSRPDFLLQNGELLSAFEHLRIVAYEDVFLENPARFVQRLVAVRPLINLQKSINTSPQAIRFPASSGSLE